MNFEYNCVKRTERWYALFFSLIAGMALATDNVFSVAEGDASVPGNWSLTHVPNSVEDARVQNGRKMTISSDLTVRQLLVGHQETIGMVIQTNGTVNFNVSGGTTSLYLGNTGLTGYYDMLGGTLNIPGQMSVGYNGIGVLDVSGGTVNLADTTGYHAIGREASGVGLLRVSGTGRVSVGKANAMTFGESGKGQLTVLDGGQFSSSSKLTLGFYAPGRGVINLGAGGTVKVDAVGPREGQAEVNCVGGTLAPYGTGAMVENYLSGTSPLLQAGGLAIDTAGKTVTVPASFSSGNMMADKLVHRWSFNNGDLADSVGGKNATIQNDAGVVYGSTGIRLPGGTPRTTYLNLGSGIFPDSDAITIELWTTGHGETANLSNWSRIFTAKGSAANQLFFMTWTKAGGFANDLIALQSNADDRQWTSDTLAPWGPDLEYHLGIVMTKGESGWKLRFYRQHARTGQTLRSVEVAAPSGWSPSVVNNALGLGWDNDASDAAATYSEMRVWKTALTERELTLSAALGQDAVFESTTGLTKKGEGALVLSGANSYSGSTRVERGLLALDSFDMPVHRWSFNNGDLTDSVGGRNATIQNDANVVYGQTGIRLPGGTPRTTFLNLGSGIFPESDEITLELWATVHQEAHTWARIFTAQGSVSSDLFFMVWRKTSGFTEDLIALEMGADAKQWKSDSLGAWTPEKAYHIVIVMKKIDSSWTLKVYKQDAQTGETLATSEVTATNGWTPFATNAKFGLGWDNGSSDSAATYDEMRVWSRALTADEVTTCGRYGPDRLPVFGTSGVAAALSPNADIELAADSTLAILGASATARGLSGSGQILGPGALTLTGAIRPGGEDAGMLTVGGGLALSGTVEIGEVGDALTFAPNETYDVSGLAFEFADGFDVSELNTIVVGHAQDAGLTGSFDASKLPEGWKLVVRSSGDIVARRTMGSLFWVK